MPVRQAARPSIATDPERRDAPPPPALGWLLLEPARAVLDFCASCLGSTPVRCGDGHPVIVYPGLGTGALTTARLRRHLEGAGFDARDWGQGLNRGPRGETDAWLDELALQVEAIYRAHGARVSLIGWSLGGLYARELARRMPLQVRQVVTLGTPFNAPPQSTRALGLFRLLNAGASPPVNALQRRWHERLPVPSTSIYSRTDGVVPWQGCVQPRAPRAENVEVNGASHLGLPHHPQALKIVVDRLCLPDGLWRPYEAPA